MATGGTKNVEDLQDAKSTAGLIGATWGRFGALPATMLLDPLSPTATLDTMSHGEAQKIFNDMRAKYPEQLANTKVQLGGHNFKQNFLSAWNNKNQLPVWRHLHALRTIPEGIGSALMRNNQYDPVSDTVTLYAKSPAILRHELGHAVDYNSYENPEDKGTLTGGAKNLLYNLSYLHPLVKLRHEAEASGHALDSVDNNHEATREAWSRLAPAYGTYLGGATAALAYMGLLGADAAELPVWAAPAFIGGGALAGHGVAAVRNYLADRERDQQQR